MLLYYYALKSIPKEIYEAAEIDGSTKIERFFHNTLPLLRPIIALVVLYGVISNVYSFNIITMMFGNGAGLPGRYGDLILPNIFRNVFGVWDFGMGAAMSVLLMFALAIYSLVWVLMFIEDLSIDFKALLKLKKFDFCFDLANCYSAYSSHCLDGVGFFNGQQ